MMRSSQISSRFDQICGTASVVHHMDVLFFSVESEERRVVTLFDYLNSIWELIRL